MNVYWANLMWHCLQEVPEACAWLKKQGMDEHVARKGKAASVALKRLPESLRPVALRVLQTYLDPLKPPTKTNGQKKIGFLRS